MFGRPKPIVIRVYGKTDVGKARDHNEDNYLVADLTKRDPSLPAGVESLASHVEAPVELARRLAQIGVVPK